MRQSHALAVALAAAVIPVCSLPAQQKRAITSSDCVTVRDLQHNDSNWRSTIKISPDSTRIAYLVKSPNFKTNENDIELYVRNLPSDSERSGKPILAGEISAMRWMPNNRYLTALLKEKGLRTLQRINSTTGDHEVLVKADRDIAEYSIDASGNTVVYAIEAPKVDPTVGPTPQEIATGYRVPFQNTDVASWLKRKLFLTRRTSSGWKTPEPITIKSPLDQQSLTALPHVGYLHPTLSPDGRQLLVTYWDFSQDLPTEWRESGFMHFRNSAGVIQAFHLVVLHDLATGETTVPLKTPFAYSAPLWSADGKSFVAVARAPVSSELEKDDVKTHRIEHSSGAHLFLVDPPAGKVERVATKLAFPWEGALFWDQNGDLLVRTRAMNTISRFSRKNGTWEEASSFQVPLRVDQEVATNGKYAIGDFNDTLSLVKISSVPEIV